MGRRARYSAIRPVVHEFAEVAVVGLDFEEEPGPEPEEEPEPVDLSKLSKKQLCELAREAGIKGSARMRKAELVEALSCLLGAHEAPTLGNDGGAAPWA